MGLHKQHKQPGQTHSAVTEPSRLLFASCLPIQQPASLCSTFVSRLSFLPGSPVLGAGHVQVNGEDEPAHFIHTHTAVAVAIGNSLGNIRMNCVVKSAEYEGGE